MALSRPHVPPRTKERGQREQERGNERRAGAKRMCVRAISILPSRALRPSFACMHACTHAQQQQQQQRQRREWGAASAGANGIEAPGLRVLSHLLSYPLTLAHFFEHLFLRAGDGASATQGRA